MSDAGGASPLPAEAIVVTELFPPMVGGSSELFANVYDRMDGSRVTILCDAGEVPATSVPNTLRHVHVIRERRRTREWGLLGFDGFRQHAANAATLRRLAAGKRVVMHCGRALPEGLDALMASPFGARPYVCWTHGEELAYVQASRELTALTHLVHARSAALIANSRNTASMLEAFGASPSAIEVVYPGVDAEQFRPDVAGAAAIRQACAADGELLLLTVGRLQRRKGHDLVLRALPGILSRVPALRYVIVGDGEERATLEALAAQLGIRQRVTFVGKVASAQLPAYYAACDLFVHPNRVERDDFEGFGIVFLEAAAAGLSVVAGNTGGAPEAVLAGSTGVLVSGTSVAELEKQVVELLCAPDVRREMGARGRARAQREFTWSRASRQVAEIHARVAELRV